MGEIFMKEHVASTKRGLLVKVILIYLAAVLLFGALNFTFSLLDLNRWAKNEFAFGEQDNQPNPEEFKNKWLPLYMEKGADGFTIENLAANLYGAEGVQNEDGSVEVVSALAQQCEAILKSKEDLRAKNIESHERRPNKVKIKTEEELLDEALKKAFPSKTDLPVFSMLYRCLFQIVIGIACIIFMKMTSARYDIGFSLAPKSWHSYLYVIPLMIVFAVFAFIKVTWAQSFAWTVLLIMATTFGDLMVAATGIYLLRAVGAKRIWKVVVPTVAIVLAHVLSWVLSRIPVIGAEGYWMYGLMEFPMFMPYMMMVLIVIPIMTLFGVVAYYKSNQIFPVFMTISLVVIGICAMFGWAVYLMPAAGVLTYGLFIAGLPICLIVAVVLLVYVLASKKPVEGDELCEYMPLER